MALWCLPSASPREAGGVDISARFGYTRVLSEGLKAKQGLPRLDAAYARGRVSTSEDEGFDWGKSRRAETFV